MIRDIAVVLLSFTLFPAINVAIGQEHFGKPANEHSIDVAVEEAPEGETAEEIHPPSTFIWMIGCLGWRYAAILPLAGLTSFVLTSVLLAKGKGQATGAAITFVVAIPVLIGLIGMFDGILSSLMMMSSSPKPSVVAEAVATGLIAPLMGLLLAAPSYLLATVGLTIRALREGCQSE